MKYTFYICFDKWKIIVYLGGSNEYYKNKSALKVINAHESKFDTFNEAIKVLED